MLAQLTLNMIETAFCTFSAVNPSKEAVQKVFNVSVNTALDGSCATGLNDSDFF